MMVAVANRMDSLAVYLLQGALLLMLGILTFSYGGEGLKWCRLTPALRRHYSRLPKGSLGWPMLGETLALRKSLMSTAPHSFVTERSLRHGKMFLTHLFGTPLVASTDAEINKFILTKEEQFIATLPKGIAMAVGENALLLMRGERHKRMRRLIIAVCSPDTLKYHAPYIQELATSIQHEWKDRKVVVADEARDFAFFVVLRLVLGLSRGQCTDRIHAKFMDLRNGVRAFPINLPGTAYRKAVEARRELETMIEEFIKERKQNKEPPFPDLLHVLLNANETDGGGDLSNAEITDLLLSSMLAGFDTSANTLLFLVYYIGQHPCVLQAIKAEHEEILKEKKPNEPLIWSDYKKMKLTQSAISETLRLANPVLSLHRKSVHDFECEGSIVPAGSAVQVWIRTIHTDPNFFPQPYNFDISRWKAGKGSSNHFHPFGVGPRICVGLELARMELCIFIHTLVTTYSWVLAEADTPRFFAEPRMNKGLPILVRELRADKSCT